MSVTLITYQISTEIELEKACKYRTIIIREAIYIVTDKSSIHYLNSLQTEPLFYSGTQINATTGSWTQASHSVGLRVSSNPSWITVSGTGV